MNLNEKLFAIQGEVEVISKDSINPFFKSRYFDINKLLETLKPLLQKHKLLLMQPLTEIGGKPALSTIIIDTETNDKASFATPIPENIDPQKMGSAITYFRRHALQSFFAIQSEDFSLQAEDDDANLASENKTEVPFVTDPDTEYEAPNLPQVCQKCGGEMKTSKQGKPYCKNLCWKK